MDIVKSKVLDFVLFTQKLCEQCVFSIKAWHYKYSTAWFDTILINGTGEFTEEILLLLIIIKIISL
jgi:hypothetical protein